jgi:hypothetical protein
MIINQRTTKKKSFSLQSKSLPECVIVYTQYMCYTKNYRLDKKKVRHPKIYHLNEKHLFKLNLFCKGTKLTNITSSTHKSLCPKAFVSSHSRRMRFKMLRKISFVYVLLDFSKIKSTGHRGNDEDLDGEIASSINRHRSFVHPSYLHHASWTNNKKKKKNNPPKLHGYKRKLEEKKRHQSYKKKRFPKQKRNYANKTKNQLKLLASKLLIFAD